MVDLVGEPALPDVKWYPLGRRTKVKSVRLVEGMPNVSSTGLKGERF